MKRIRTEAHNHGARGDERIRTAVCVVAANGTKRQGRRNDMSLDADLATLRDPFAMPGAQEEALDRVEAELARLREGLRDAVDVAIWLTGFGDLSKIEAWQGPRLPAEDGAA